MGKYQDLTGQRFGKLKVVERTEDHISPSGYKYVMWRCQCDCGNFVNVRTADLKILVLNLVVVYIKKCFQNQN